eukprot:15475266-Alexandrium_andersonii.AAC.1
MGLGRSGVVSVCGDVRGGCGWLVGGGWTDVVGWVARFPEDPERKGVAISRLAEVLLVVFEQSESERYKILLEKSVHARMVEVIKKLKPACSILNGGRLAVRRGCLLGRVGFLRHYGAR